MKKEKRVSGQAACVERGSEEARVREGGGGDGEGAWSEGAGGVNEVSMG